MLRRTGLLLLGVLVGCSSVTSESVAEPNPVVATPTAPRTSTTTAIVTPPPRPVPTDTGPPSTTLPAPTTTSSPHARPAWLGTRPLPLRPDEHGEVQPTPAELVDRQLETLDLLPPPSGDDFEWTIGPIPADVLDRSSWRPECPLAVEELSYLTMSHWGFDGEHHTGEMIVDARFAEDIVGVFARIHELRFPIEQMRVITAEEVDAHPTGDWNDTTSFVCRPAVGSGSWSNHAFGRAVDINPFHNPYEKGDLVLPELASAYLDRSRAARGMIGPGDEVVAAFAAIGWGWGGSWSSLVDYMHFSANGR